jgi:hypothetical protein
MAKIFGQLEKAQLENTTSDTGSLPKGTATYRTDLNLPKVSNGTTMKTLVDTDTSQALTNKSLDSTNTLASPVTTGAVQLQEIATPATPASGNGKIYFKSDGFLYQLNDDGTESKVGSGGGGINYITNPDAESNANDWTLYDSTAVPTTLTGGTATALWERSTSSPLRGAASFLFTAGGEGNGVATVITPASADIKAGAVQVISLEYSVTGTIAEGDYQIWVEDIANAVMIQPAGYKIPSAVSGGAYKLQPVTFQLPTNGTTFRVAIHQAVASPGGNLKVDSISVGPQTRSYGPPVTDWVSYTPTIGGLSGFSTTPYGYWRRVGDTAEYVVGWVKNGSAGVSGSFISIDLYPGHVVDTNKIRSNGNVQQVGTASAFGVFVANFEDTINVEYGTTTSVYLSRTGTANLALGNQHLANGTIGMKFSVPILGWSSSVEVSSSTDTRVIAAIATGAPQTSYTANTPIVWPTILKDTNGSYSTSTGQYTASTPGFYWVAAQINTNASGANRLKAYVNGSVYNYMGAQTSPGADIFGASLVYAEAGQTIDVRYNGTWSAVGAESSLSISRLSGPSQIAASETVAALYRSSATSSIGNALSTAMDFPTKVYDTHGAVSNAGAGNQTVLASGWKFTAPVSGKYRVACTLRIAAAVLSTSQQFSLSFFSQGVEYAMVGTAWGTGGSNAYTVNGSTTIDLLAGQTIQSVSYQNSGGAVTLFGLATFNHIAIERVGN